jgi:glycosyltransferase involved in cell wall biosynthesis
VDGLEVGRTFDPEDPADIAVAVNGLLGDPAALSRARDNVARLAPTFSWESESRKLLSVYDALDLPASPSRAGRVPE